MDTNSRRPGEIQTMLDQLRDQMAAVEEALMQLWSRDEKLHTVTLIVDPSATGTPMGLVASPQPAHEREDRVWREALPSLRPGL